MVVLRDPTTPTKQEKENNFVDQKKFKLNLYTVGFVLSWDIYSGDVEILKINDLVEGPGTIVKYVLKFQRFDSITRDFVRAVM